MPKLKVVFAAALVTALFAVPAMASGACTLPTAPVVQGGALAPGALDDGLNPADAASKSGTFGPELNGKFIQIPFNVPAGATGLRIRYCYETSLNTTLDLGVYEPNAADPGNFTAAQSRGWSGSAVKIVGIGENGFSSSTDYAVNKKAYVPGRTSRAYKPGPIPAGQWAIELGAGYIDPSNDGVDWTVEVTPTEFPSWENDPYTPDPYEPNVGNPAAGWYAGDLHVHGEQEPGNALTGDTLDLAFEDPPAGNGLDFITLVDHNNNISRTQLGQYQGEHPDKVVIPGTEMTTYNGHFNAQGNSPLVDFRLGEIKRFADADSDSQLDPGELQDVRGIEDPSSRFASIQSGGGWAQINHPTIFKTAPAACRGCFWNYDDARTDFSQVNAIEIQTGPAGIPQGAPDAAMNPFTTSAIEYYEYALATGAHIAAVGSSDDHQAGGASGPFDSTVGHGATVVRADQLSQAGIIAAVKAGHTYVKPFGPDAPDVEMLAGEPGKVGLTAIPGDSVAGATMNIQLRVTRAGASAARPGPYTLEVLKDGRKVDSAAVDSDDFRHSYTATETGRYSFKLTRPQGVATMIEAYSTPVWFTKTGGVTPPIEPSNRFSFAGVKLNKKKGTAALKVKVPGAGVVKLAGKNVGKATAKPAKARTVSLTVKATGKLKKQLRKKRKAIARTKVTFTPAGGKAATKSKAVKLKLAKKKKKSKR